MTAKLAARVVARHKAAADMGLDPSQEDLFDALLLIAENDGDAYRKRDAAAAVATAWKDWKKETDENLAEDFRAIKSKLEKALKDRWKREGKESRQATIPEPEPPRTAHG